MIDLIQDYNLVSFYPLCIDDPETVVEIIRVCDRAVGFYGFKEDESLFKTVDKCGEWMDEWDRVMEISEKYVSDVKERDVGQEWDELVDDEVVDDELVEE
jgi:hypothetical protein